MAQQVTQPVADEKRVIDILEARGGRAWQQEIVEATGWSPAKVSLLLSGMEDQGEIYKQSTGRENLVSTENVVSKAFDGP